MDVRNCKGCSRLFNYIGGQPLCPECAKALDLKFDEVRDYVYDHPRAGMQEVAEENDVTIAQIKRWIREERLAFSEDAQVGLECEGCGKMIRTGRFCETCKAKYINDFSSYIKPREEPKMTSIKGQGPQMRFLDRK
ncbi:MAG: flagellar protein [Lachnospiraceae bacterium]|nr:flagellar protein [Lachnospiraceae bacterium]